MHALIILFSLCSVVAQEKKEKPQSPVSPTVDESDQGVCILPLLQSNMLMLSVLFIFQMLSLSSSTLVSILLNLLHEQKTLAFGG